MLTNAKVASVRGQTNRSLTKRSIVKVPSV